MFSFLLALIYLAFISLGLPDSLLGAGWPAMQQELGVPSSYAGILSLIIALSTITSSLATSALTRRLGTGKLTACSVLISALALLGFGLCGNFWLLCLLAIPYGLSAGAVDAALNHYVALNYAARHLSWLHCFWGVGVSLSPGIMSYTIHHQHGWSGAYLIVFALQALIALTLLLSLKQWKKEQPTTQHEEKDPTPKIGIKAALNLPHLKTVLLTFFCYCGLENSASLWASSFLSQARAYPTASAAACASIFFIGITAGRFGSGWLTLKYSDKQMIQGGLSIMFIGSALLALPLLGGSLSLIGLILLGLGCAPIYPTLIHTGPNSFGRDNSQAVISLMMAAAYLGTLLLPPLFGILASIFGINILPFYTFILVLTMYLSLQKSLQNNQQTEKELPKTNQSL